MTTLRITFLIFIILGTEAIINHKDYTLIKPVLFYVVFLTYTFLPKKYRILT